MRLTKPLQRIFCPLGFGFEFSELFLQKLPGLLAQLKAGLQSRTDKGRDVRISQLLRQAGTRGGEHDLDQPRVFHRVHDQQISQVVVKETRIDPVCKLGRRGIFLRRRG